MIFVLANKMNKLSLGKFKNIAYVKMYYNYLIVTNDLRLNNELLINLAICYPYKETKSIKLRFSF